MHMGWLMFYLNLQKVNHTIIGGGIIPGYVKGASNLRVTTKATTMNVQCRVNNTWVSYGGEPIN